MNEKVFIREELVASAGIEQKVLDDWEKLNLLKPVGYTDDKTPFYSPQTIERIQQIQKLFDLGYELADIQKIIKKIGLPKTGTLKAKKNGSAQYLTIGALADKVGVSPRTIKHWEDKGIIEADMRSHGGFRLYSELYVYLCNLIKDLQLFGYSLEDIKKISDYFRDFLAIQGNPDLYSKEETEKKIEVITREIKYLFDKINLFKQGIQRWEELLKKKRKEDRKSVV